MNKSSIPISKISTLLQKNKWVKLLEILFVFIIAFVFIKLMSPWVNGNPMFKQAVIWFAYILMLLIIALGMKLRGEDASSFGLNLGRFTLESGFKIMLLSLLTFVLAAGGFILGSIIMANITGIPEGSNFDGLNYIKDNLLILMVSLLGVYIVSSFGEEVIYRGFLIKRIEELEISKKHSTKIALIISSVVFGLIHYEWGPMGMVQTGFMGLALGLCYVKMNRKLWIMILSHGYMDTILLVQLYFAE